MVLAYIHRKSISTIIKMMWTSEKKKNHSDYFHAINCRFGGLIKRVAFEIQKQRSFWYRTSRLQSCQYFLLMFFDLFGGHEIQKIYVRRVKCSVNLEYVQSNYSCYAKSFNRSCSTGTVMINFKSRVPWLYVRIFSSRNGVPRHLRS